MRTTYDKKHNNIVHTPVAKANMGELSTTFLIETRQAAVQKVTYPTGYWLEDPDYRKEFAQIVKLFQAKFDNVKIFQQPDNSVEICIVDNLSIMKISFGLDFPQAPPKLFLASGAEQVVHSQEEWMLKENIFESVKLYLNL